MKNVSIAAEPGIKIEKKMVHRLISGISKREGFKIDSLEINFVNESTIMGINKKYLKHKYPTDIITFNYSGANDRLEGEIFICIKVALENSLKFDVNLDSELVRLIIHGLLHLLGFDDIGKNDRKKMKIKEDELVNAFEFEYKNLIIEYDCEDC